MSTATLALYASASNVVGSPVTVASKVTTCTLVAPGGANGAGGGFDGTGGDGGGGVGTGGDDGDVGGDDGRDGGGDGSPGGRAGLQTPHVTGHAD